YSVRIPARHLLCIHGVPARGAAGSFSPTSCTAVGLPGGCVGSGADARRTDRHTDRSFHWRRGEPPQRTVTGTVAAWGRNRDGAVAHFSSALRQPYRRIRANRTSG